MAISFRTDPAPVRDVTAMLVGSLRWNFRRPPREVTLTSDGQETPQITNATLDSDFDTPWFYVQHVGVDERARQKAPTLATIDNKPAPADETTKVVSGDDVDQAATWVRLLTAAETGDSREFLSAYRSMDWTRRSPEQLVFVVRLSITAGHPLLARALASEGAQRYPEHAELQKAARVLAPPRVISHSLPPDPGIAANVDWLRDHRDQYQGKWVALRDGVLLKDASSREEVLSGMGDLRTQRILVTKVY